MASRGEAREHEAREHGSTKQEGSSITKNTRFAASFCVLFPYFKVLFRSALSYFVPGWQIVPLKIAASGAKCALLAMTNLVGFAGKRNNFRNETFEKRCEAIPHKKQPQKMKNVRFPNKNVPILCHCEERSDAAILKFEARHPVTKHGSTKQEESPITKKGIRCVVLLPLSSF